MILINHNACNFQNLKTRKNSQRCTTTCNNSEEFLEKIKNFTEALLELSNCYDKGIDELLKVSCKYMQSISYSSRKISGATFVQLIYILIINPSLCTKEF